MPLDSRRGRWQTRTARYDGKHVSTHDGMKDEISERYAPGVTCFSGTDPDWAELVISRCGSLRTGYKPHVSVRNGHLQNLLYLVNERRTPSVSWDLEERLVMADGGTVSVQWLGLAGAQVDSPVVLVLHTLCGSADALARQIRSLHDGLGGLTGRSWIIAACNRRGHGDLELTAPVVNTMGSTSDLRMQIAAISARRPDAALYGVGVSAGSGLLVRYLGEERESSRLRAGVALCPAYDLRDAFDYADPLYDRYLTRKSVQFFLERNQAVLAEVDGYRECTRASTLSEFHRLLYPLAGYPSLEDYFRNSNPMEVADDVTIPMLIVNAADDPVCSARNVYANLGRLRRLGRVTLALTRYGGHCGFFDTAFSSGSWVDRLTAEYLAAVHHELGDGRSPVSVACGGSE